MNYHKLIEDLRLELKNNASEYTIEELRNGYEDLAKLIEEWQDSIGLIPIVIQDF